MTNNGQLFKNGQVKNLQYTASSVEVLEGLDPVRRRPGMYTDTQRPNHLAQEVIDNSTDEAISGYATRIDVVLFEDGSIQVADNGRGMPVDMHPTEKISGVEVIMTRLHAGAKFSNKDYQFSGGLHGVGVSVVNALSKRLEVEIYRDGQQYEIGFEGGNKVRDLEMTGSVGQRRTGTKLRFWPDPQYFDSITYSIPKLRAQPESQGGPLPGADGESLTIKYPVKPRPGILRPGWPNTSSTALTDTKWCRKPHSEAISEGQDEYVSWSAVWLSNGGEAVCESYVNLIPTTLGGTHVNGFQAGAFDRSAVISVICVSFLPRGDQAVPG